MAVSGSGFLFTTNRVFKELINSWLDFPNSHWEKENQEKFFGKLTKCTLLLAMNHFQRICNKIDAVKTGK